MNSDAKDAGGGGRITPDTDTERAVCSNCGIWIDTKPRDNGVWVGCACTSAVLSKWDVETEQ